MFSFLKGTAPPRRTIEAIYGMIVAQARRPEFYTEFAVPDTVEGRFDMVVLHLWMVLRHLRSTGDSDLAQATFDCFCDDMDDNLREMGVGDLAVPKRMQAFGEAFYGRTAAYDTALVGGGDDLAIAIDRNILNGTDIESARAMASYVHQALGCLDETKSGEVSGTKWPLPVRVSHE